jgi:antitoxin VapB
MQRTAKLFRNGRSQAVRLPADCRFEGTGVFIASSGNVILSSRPHSTWQSFFNLRDQTGVPQDFVPERGDGPPQKRKLFR